MATTMDCMCWMEGGYMIGADWRSWLGLLEAFPLSWWPGLVAIDLVRTMQPFVEGRQIVKHEINLPTNGAN